jgi:hypothetical protein
MAASAEIYSAAAAASPPINNEGAYESTQRRPKMSLLEMSWCSKKLKVALCDKSDPEIPPSDVTLARISTINSC